MKVVIIDDEPLISDKLKRIMETGLRGMHTVCAFTDAQTALDYIEQEKPGVILTDIRMPGITGIDLAKQINQMDYGAKIVFLTGYAEFEYARYGIEYKVFDYLLKPVDEQEAIKCLNRAISAFHAEQKHTEMYQIFQDYFVKNQELIRQQFVEKLFFQPVIFSEKQMELQKQKLRIAINGYRVVAVTYDRNRMPLEEESYYSYIIHEFFLKKFKEILALEHGGIFYMIWPTEEKTLWKFCSKLELIRRELAQLQPLDCMIAVSHYSENLSDIQQMKKEVLKCLEYGKDTGCTQLLSYQDLPMEYKENDFFDVTEAITELIRYLRSGNKKKIFEQMQKIINETEKETEKYFNNIMELIGANIFLFLSGIPFGIHKMRLILIPKGMDITATLGMAVLSVIIGALIGSIMIPVYVLLTVARRHNVTYLNGIFEMKNSKMPIFITQPYIYVANNFENFNCMVEQLTAHTWGLQMLFPFFALTGLKFVFPQLVTIPDFVTKTELTTLTMFYDAYYDFGIIGTALFAFIIGLTAAAVSIPVRQKKNPMTYMFYGQIAIYLGLAFFTTWFSNPTTWFWLALTLMMYWFVGYRRKGKGSHGRK